MQCRKKRMLGIAALVVLLAAGGWLLGLYLRKDEHLSHAEEAIARRDFRAASEHISRYLEKRPNDLSARLLAAQTARREGAAYRFHQHLRQFEASGGSPAAVQLERRLFAVQGGDLMELDALLDLAGGDPDGANTPLILEACIQGHLLRMPEKVEPGMMSKDCKSLPDQSRLIWAANLWLQKRPSQADQIEGLFWRGRLRQLAYQSEEGLADFRQVLAMQPNHFDARWQLILVLVDMNLEEAVMHLESLTRTHPQNAKVVYLLGSVRRGLGQFETAQHILDDLVAKAPEYVPALVERGKVSIDLQRLEDAEKWLQRAYAIAPNDRDVNVALWRCLHLRGKEDLAKPYRERVQQMDAEKQRINNEVLRKCAELEAKSK